MNTLVREIVLTCDLENPRVGTVRVYIDTGDKTGIFFVDTTGPYSTKNGPTRP